MSYKAAQNLFLPLEQRPGSARRSDTFKHLARRVSPGLMNFLTAASRHRARSLISGQTDTTRFCVSSLAVGLVASCCIRFILIHEKETEREKLTMHLFSCGLFSSSAGCHNTCVLWSSNCWCHTKCLFVRYCLKRHRNNPSCFYCIFGFLSLQKSWSFASWRIFVLVKAWYNNNKYINRSV